MATAATPSVLSLRLTAVDAASVHSTHCGCVYTVCAVGSDVNYYLQGSVAAYTIGGSRKIRTGRSSYISNADVTFHTRTFMPIPGTTNSPFGPAKAGGDGTTGVLGPALKVQPGQTMSLLLKNAISDVAVLDGPLPYSEEAAYLRMERLRKDNPDPVLVDFDAGHAVINFTGPQFTQTGGLSSEPVNDPDEIPTCI